MKVAVIGAPIIGGGYTTFKYLNEYSQNRVELITIGFSEDFNHFFEDEAHTSLGSSLESKHCEFELAQLLKSYLEENKFDILIPMNSPIAIGLVPFLDKRIKVIHRVNNHAPRVYKYCSSYVDRTAAIICNSNRQFKEIKKYVKPEFFENHVYLIPHGVPAKKNFSQLVPHETIRIGYIGRLEQKQKNILLIAEILSKINFPFTFEIIGDGTARKEFLKRLESLNINYKYLGVIPNQKISDFLKFWDVFIFPSIYEGFGYTILEAMNNGVVPMCNKIPDVTDFILKDGFDGFIVEQNNVEDYVQKLNLLNFNRELLYKMKSNAIESVAQKFDIQKVVDKYDYVFSKSFDSVVNFKIKDFSKWQPYREYKPPFLQRFFNRFSI